jgi:transcriptional regulator with XRE-family HTH domain
VQDRHYHPGPPVVQDCHYHPGPPGSGRLDGMESASRCVGSYLRLWRARLQPTDVGLPDAGRRRTRGLRREELATLAGISVDYLIRLEQGRAVSPSPAVLASLARALRLAPEERDHLYVIAGHAPPKRTNVSSQVSPGVRRLVDRLGDVPVAVYDAAWTIILWNPSWAALMGDPAALSGRERNLLWRVFTRPATRVTRSEQEISKFQEAAVADIRRVTGAYPGDARLQQLVADLRQASPLFDELWLRGVVTQPDTGPKTIVHPELGQITLDCDVLTVAGTDLRVIVYTVDPDSPDAQKLDLLKMGALPGLGARASHQG